MASIVIAGDTSGTVTLTAPAVAGTVVLTLPTASGTPALTSSTLTSGRVPFAGASGVLQDSANLVFDGTNLGIGSATPTNRLEVSGSARFFSAANGDILISHSGLVSSIFSATSVSLALGTGNTERARFNTTGALVFAGGDTSANGIGITFPTTQSASTNANTLDDYEEGTWTPSLGGTAVYNIQYGNYVKIGRLVYVTGAIRPTSIGTGSTTIISGLPFSVTANNADAGGQTGYYDSCASSIFSMTFALTGSGTTIVLNSKTAAGTSVNNGASTAFFGNNTRLYFSATYQTD